MSTMSSEAFLRATEAVVAACMQDERFTVIAVGGACPGAALYATAHRDRVTQLVCLDPVAPLPLAPVVRNDWSMGRRMIASAVFPAACRAPAPVQPESSDSISQSAWIAASEAYVAIDQRSVFEQVPVPTLFIARATREMDRQHAVRLAAAVDAHAWC